ncbi:MAG: hypothetical protein ACI3XA_02685 [Clostridia bacterium]
MKKLTAIICTIAMLLSVATTAYGAGADIFFQVANEYDATVEYRMELNKPLDILNYITEELFSDDDLNKIDVKYLIESILKGKVTVDIKAKTNPENYKKASCEMKINFNVPVNVSEDIKTATDLTAYLWMDLDLTSEENAKYLIVFKNPLNGKYLYLDMFEEAVFGEETVKELKKSMIDASNQVDANKSVTDMTNLVKSAYTENATIIEKDRTITMSFTNDGFVEFIFDFIEGMINLDELKQAFETSGIAIDNSQFAMLKPMIKGLGIFADKDAVVVAYTTDVLGKPKEIEEKIHLDFNIVELCETLGLTEADLYPITKDKANVDVTFCAKSIYNKFNENVTVTMPVLTEENSVSLAEVIYNYFNDDYDYDYEDYQWEEFYNYAGGVVKGDMYVSVEDFLESAEYDSDNLKIQYNTVTKEDGKEVIQMIISNDYMEPVTVEGTTNDNSYTIDGVTFNDGVAFIYNKDNKETETYEGIYATEEVDVLCVNVNILKNVLKCELESMTVYFIDYETGETMEVPGYEFWFNRPNMGYTAE